MSTPAAEKPFMCTDAGCDKSFVRAEHLARHRLNREFGSASDSAGHHLLMKMKIGLTRYTPVLAVQKNLSARTCTSDIRRDMKKECGIGRLGEW